LETAAADRPPDDRRQAGGIGSRVARFGLDWAMQMIERPWGVTAYGTASVKAAPDLVRLRFHVARLEQAPAQASEAVGAVRRAIRARDVPDVAVQRSRLSLRSRWSGNGAVVHIEDEDPEQLRPGTAATPPPRWGHLRRTWHRDTWWSGPR
jgi:hypothetical protein